MNEYTTMLYDQKQLIIKTAEGKQPVVIATCYLPETSADIIEGLRLLAEKRSQASETSQS